MSAITSMFQKVKEQKKENYILREIVDEVVKEHQVREAKKPNHRAGAFHPSQIGRCPRMLIYSYFANELGIKQPIHSTKFFMVFENGHFMHDRYNKWFKKAEEFGIIEDLRLNVKLSDINPEFCKKYNVEGEWDLDFKYKGVWYLVDFKSMRWELFKVAAKKRSSLYFDQLHLYYLAAGFKDKGILMYECKNDQSIDEVSVPFDKERACKIKKKLTYLNKCVKAFTLPKRECTTKGDAMKAWCPYVEECWEICDLKSIKPKKAARKNTKKKVSKKVSK